MEEVPPVSLAQLSRVCSAEQRQTPKLPSVRIADHNPDCEHRALFLFFGGMGEMLNLDDRLLLRSRIYVNGQWLPGDSEQSMPVRNPVDRSVIGRVPLAS